MNKKEFAVISFGIMAAAVQSVLSEQVESLTQQIPQSGLQTVDVDRIFSLGEEARLSEANRSQFGDRVRFALQSSPMMNSLVEHHAPKELVAAGIATEAYRQYRISVCTQGIPSPNAVGSIAKAVVDEVKSSGLITGDISQEQIKRWLRVERLNEMIQRNFESAISGEIAQKKLVGFGLPTIYVGADRESTAQLAAMHALSVNEIVGNPYVIFACDSSNVDVYNAISKEQQARGLILNWLVTHLDEYDLRKPGAPRVLTEEHYKESFVVGLQKIWDMLGIPEHRRAPIDGLTENPEKIAEGIRGLHEALGKNRALGLAILGLGPRDSPHVAFLDELEKIFVATAYVKLSETTQQRDILRGQDPHDHAISLGSIEILRTPFIQQTFFHPHNSEPSKVRGLVEALQDFPNIHPTHSSGICGYAPSRWRIFTTQQCANEILNTSDLYVPRSF